MSSEFVTDSRAILAFEEFPTARWNAIRDTGFPVIVSYHFAQGADLPLADDLSREASATAAFDQEMRDAFRRALDIYEDTAGVIFVERPLAGAMIDVFAALDTPVAGWASPPVVTSTETSAGRFVIDPAVGDPPTGFGFELILHELGHSMGLDHPFEGPFRLSEEFDNTAVTVMSYTTLSEPMETLGWMDTAALQQLYGRPVDTEGWELHFEGAVFVARGGAGDDSMLGVGGVNRIDGRKGDDIIIGREDGDRLKGGVGADRLYGLDGTDLLAGGAGPDELWAEDAPELDALATVTSFTDDTLKGGGGDDTLYGSAGRNQMKGGGGDDLLIGDPNESFGSPDRMAGNDGRDTLMGGCDGDRMSGGNGRDLLIGDADADRAGPDRMNGGRGNDTLRGGYGVDTLIGGGGADRLVAETAPDGSAGDVLQGGRGSDTLVGGTGRDRFVFTPDDVAGTDMVLNLSLEYDRFDLSALPFDPDRTSFSSAGNGTDALVRLDIGDATVSILVMGIAAATLEQAWDGLIAL